MMKNESMRDKMGVWCIIKKVTRCDCEWSFHIDPFNLNLKTLLWKQTLTHSLTHTYIFLFRDFRFSISSVHPIVHWIKGCFFSVRAQHLKIAISRVFLGVSRSSVIGHSNKLNKTNNRLSWIFDLNLIQLHGISFWLLFDSIAVLVELRWRDFESLAFVKSGINIYKQVGCRDLNPPDRESTLFLINHCDMDLALAFERQTYMRWVLRLRPWAKGVILTGCCDDSTQKKKTKKRKTKDAL